MHRIALVIGALGGLAWLSLAVQPAECLPPSEATEVACNRLWTAPLAAMAVGGLGLWAAFRRGIGPSAPRSLAVMAVGFGAMALGNGVEYWILSNLPHTGAAGLPRSLLWMTTLAGWLATLVAALVFGRDLWRSGGPRRWFGLAYAAALPLSVLLPAIRMGTAGVPIGLLAILGAGLGLSAARRPLAVT